MAYCTEDDLLQMISASELAALTTESGDEPDVEVVNGAISKAEGEIDSYVGSRYAVPLSPAPAQVQALAVDLALYHLYARRSIVPPVRKEKYAAAVVWLRQVAAGEAVLAVAAATAPEMSREAPDIDAKTRCFSRCTLGEW
jgi:phage gp36-like protein